MKKIKIFRAWVAFFSIFQIFSISGARAGQLENGSPYYVPALVATVFGAISLGQVSLGMLMCAPNLDEIALNDPYGRMSSGCATLIRFWAANSKFAKSAAGLNSLILSTGLTTSTALVLPGQSAAVFPDLLPDEAQQLGLSEVEYQAYLSQKAALEIDIENALVNDETKEPSLERFASQVTTLIDAVKDFPADAKSAFAKIAIASLP